MKTKHILGMALNIRKLASLTPRGVVGLLACASLFAILALLGCSDAPERAKEREQAREQERKTEQTCRECASNAYHNIAFDYTAYGATAIKIKFVLAAIRKSNASEDEVSGVLGASQYFTDGANKSADYFKQASSNIIFLHANNKIDAQAKNDFERFGEIVKRNVSFSIALEKGEYTPSSISDWEKDWTEGVSMGKRVVEIVQKLMECNRQATNNTAF